MRMIDARYKKKTEKSHYLSPRPGRQLKNKQKKLHLVLEPQRGQLVLPSLTVSPSLVFEKVD